MKLSNPLYIFRVAVRTKLGELQSRCPNIVENLAQRKHLEVHPSPSRHYEILQMIFTYMSMELTILIERNRPGSCGKAIAEIPDLKCEHVCS